MSNAMMATTTEMTMSSRDLAALVEARHDSVKRTIERLASRDVIEFPPLVEIPTTTKSITEFRVGKRDSYVIVAQLSPEFTARLVDRWQELEKQVAQPQVPQSFAEALRLAADTQEQLEQAEQEKKQAQQRVSTYEKVTTQHEHTLHRVIRTFPGVNTMKIKSDLMFYGYLHKSGSTYKVYSHKKHLFQERIDDEYGKVEIIPTEKGKQLLIELYERGALTMKKGWK